MLINVFFSHRRTWYRKFRAALNACATLDEIERLLRVKVERWRDKTPRPMDEEDEDESDCDEELTHTEIVEDFGSLFLE
jgi:tRNA-dihydrouridine synthase 1